MLRRVILSLILSLVSLAAYCEEPLTRSNRFAWGAEIGSGIDLTGSDMSTIDFGVCVGYSHSWINLLGISAGVDMMMSNSSRYFPLCAVLRTGFNSHPGRWFMDLRAGVAINNIYDRGSKSALYLSPGVGFYLARGRTFESYVGLNYIYNDIDYQTHLSDEWPIKHGLSQMSVRIGVTF